LLCYNGNVGNSLQAIIFASTNPAKLSQLRYVIDHFQFEVTVIPAAEQYGDAGRYREIGPSAVEIAANGASTVAQRIGRPVLTEDSTFEVDALGGEPSVKAGSYLKTHGRPGILQALEGVENRTARIVSAVAYAELGEEPLVWSRTIPGRITQREIWRQGLPDWIAPSPAAPLGGGYNAIFVPAGETRTLAQIPPAEGLYWGYREPLFYAALRWVTG